MWLALKLLNSVSLLEFGILSAAIDCALIRLLVDFMSWGVTNRYVILDGHRT